uniref:Uncharacterized protein n=1 Tax=Arundo donax TaxID=35708 RepID=A0A0A9GSH1_ARUDO
MLSQCVVVLKFDTVFS